MQNCLEIHWFFPRKTPVCSQFVAIPVLYYIAAYEVSKHGCDLGRMRDE